MKRSARKVIDEVRFAEKYNLLRLHQKEISEYANRLIFGAGDTNKTTVYVTPAGGKTKAAVILAGKLIDAGKADIVCVVVPRDSLRAQFVKGAIDRNLGIELILGMEGNRKVQQLALDDRHGIVVTIQSLARRPDRFIKRFKGLRLLLIIDEAHHLADETGGGWIRAIRPLVEMASHVLIMSGTPYRNDGQPIPFIDYDENGEGRFDISYDRRTAQNETAVRIVEAILLDGDYEFSHKDKLYTGTISEASGKLRERGAVKAAVRSDGFRLNLIDRAIEHWTAYRESSGYKSRMIVLADEQIRAQEIVDYLRRNGLDAKLAISDDGEKGKKALSAFRDKKDGDILVTVGMAYEGFDCPDCTHLVCLTRIRSWPWLEQAFARVMRIDRNSPLSPNQQRAFICTVGDPISREFFKQFLETQPATFDEKAAREATTKTAPARGDFISVRGATQEGETLYEANLGHLSKEDEELLRRVRADFPTLKNAPISEALPLAYHVYKKPSAAE